MTQWLGAALVAVGIIGVWATGASPSLGAGEDPALLLDDPGFSAVTLESMGRWEVRYAIKDSDPASRPRWHVVPRLDDGDTAHAQHLSVEEYGPAAGRVLIGRRIQLPQSIEGLEFSLDFQTYCSEEGRSGSVSLAVFAVDVWDALSADPENVTSMPEPIVKDAVHPNGDDVTRWQHTAMERTMWESLASLAGQEVVCCVIWETWHTGAKEWARFDNFRVGEPGPAVNCLGWARWAYRGEPLTLAVEAFGADHATVTLRHRLGEAPWQSSPMMPVTARRFEGTVPKEAVGDGLHVQAVMSRQGKPDVLTETVTIGMTKRPHHPCLLYSRDEIEAMQAKIERHDWAKATLESIRRSADAWLARDDDPPTGQGGWSHDYVCPEDGARLTFRERSPHAHLCPSCKKEFTGEKLDATWLSEMHGRFANGAKDCAMAYQLTGDERYGRRAAQILTWYADHYADFPLGKGPAGRGRVMSQSLTECSWLISMFTAADLAWPAMTQEERAGFEQRLVRAGAEHIKAYRFGIHNIQCWHNACYGCAGYFLGDPDMVRWAKEGKTGFDAQVSQGILEDGTWFERSLGYHSYTLSALTVHCEAARHAGEDLYKSPGLQRMFTLPLRLAQPNLVPPSLNDQGYTTGRVSPEPLERAVGWYGDETAARALAHLYATGATRKGLVALQHGGDLPDFGPYEPPGSEDLPGVGLAVLRNGTGEDATCAMLDYGEHGGGHGHFDKLQLILYGLGQTLCPDPGTTGYGVALHGKWYKQTAAHNTVVIGTASQKATKAELLSFQATRAEATAAADCIGAYEGFRLSRRIVLSGRTLVDVYTVEGDREESIDWLLRAPGELTLSLPTSALQQEAPNPTYAYFEAQQVSATDGDWTATWEVDDKGGRLLVTMQAAPGTQVISALAPGIPGQRPWHTLRVRRQGSHTAFRAVYQMLKPGETPQPVEWTAGGVQVGERLVALDEGG